MMAVILGSGASLQGDIAALGEWTGTVIAVNRAGIAYPGRIDHWVTLHPEMLEGFMEERAIAYGPSDFTTWSQRPHDDAQVDRVVTDIEPKGSSGLFAARIALRHLGCDRVVLAGIPIDDGPHFYDADGVRSGPAFRYYRPAWLRARRQEFSGRVRSLSGWTREILGSPDNEWLAANA